MFRNKTVVVGVTGGIAAYKTCELVSRLRKEGAEVHVVMTKNATRFVSELTFETLSNNRVVSDMFDRDYPWEVEHISLAKKADVFVIAPCSANVMAKYACGIADDFLTTTLLAAKCPVLIAPAMNCNMLSAQSVQANMETLKRRGVFFVESETGRLACGDEGKGRLASVDAIYRAIANILFPKQDYAGKTVLITAGATREAVDPVRFLTNRSSGKMGLALCSAVKRRGGKVILVAGFMRQPARDYDELIEVTTTAEMYDAVLGRVKDCDMIIKAAAPSDYKVKEYAASKIKASKLCLELEKNPDIAEAVGRIKGDKKLIIFCAETENLTENAVKKLAAKHADMVVANDVTMEGAGFDVDTNVITIVTEGDVRQPVRADKSVLSDIILDAAAML